MDTTYAVYELVAVLLALPLSYGLAYIIKKWSNRLLSYQKHIDLLFVNYWNGNPCNELTAWLRVRRQILNHSPSRRELKYIDKKINEVDKQSYLSSSYITADGDINLDNNPPVIQFDDPQNI